MQLKHIKHSLMQVRHVYSRVRDFLLENCATCKDVVEFQSYLAHCEVVDLLLQDTFTQEDLIKLDEKGCS